MPAATRTPARTCSRRRPSSMPPSPSSAGPPVRGTGTTRTCLCTSRSRSSPRLRAANPALTDGAQVHRYASDGPGIYAFSRVDRADRPRVPRRGQQRDGGEVGQLRDLQRPAALRGRLRRHERAEVRQGRAGHGDGPGTVGAGLQGHRSASPSARLRPRSTSPRPSRVQSSVAVPRSVPRSPRTPSPRPTFLYRPVGTSAWKALGTDDSAPYRVFHDVSGMADGTLARVPRRGQGQQREHLCQLVLRHRGQARGRWR